MFRFLAFLGKLIIPIIVIILSILTMLPESNIHLEQLNNDNFFPKITREIKKNVFVLTNPVLTDIGLMFPNQEDVVKNQTLVEAYSKNKEEVVIENSLKVKTTSSLKKISDDIKNGPSQMTTTNDQVSKAINIIYKYRLFVALAIVIYILLLFLFAIFGNNKSFYVLYRFFKGVSSSTLVFTILSFVGISGSGILIPSLRKQIGEFIGINNLTLESLDIINISWLKFIGWLLTPAILTIGIFVLLTLFFGFISLFQREKKEAKKMDEKLEQKGSKGKIANNELSLNSKKENNNSSSNDKTINNSTSNGYNVNNNSNTLDEVTLFNEKIEKSQSNPTLTQNPDSIITPNNSGNNFKTVSNAPYPVEEFKPREDLDPFLERLSQTVYNTNTVESTGSQKIILPSEKK